MNSLGQRSAGRPIVIGPITALANFADFNVWFDAPDWEGQLENANVMVNTTIGTQGTNFLTIHVRKTDNLGAGSATSMSSITTNSSGGVALTAARRNMFTNSTTLANLRYKGYDSESADATRDLLSLFFDAATATIAAIDTTHQMMVSVRLTPGAVGHAS